VVEQDGRTFAWVIDVQGHVRKRPIQVTFEDSRARIEDGLQEGETVVLDPPGSLSEGLEVNVGD
jgi:hypothetical protein